MTAYCKVVFYMLSEKIYIMCEKERHDLLNSMTPAGFEPTICDFSFKYTVWTRFTMMFFQYYNSIQFY